MGSDRGVIKRHQNRQTEVTEDQYGTYAKQTSCASPHLARKHLSGGCLVQSRLRVYCIQHDIVKCDAIMNASPMMERSPVTGLMQRSSQSLSLAWQVTSNIGLQGCAARCMGRAGGMRGRVRMWGWSWCCRSSSCNLPAEEAHSIVNLQNKFPVQVKTSFQNNECLCH